MSEYLVFTTANKLVRIVTGSDVDDDYVNLERNKFFNANPNIYLNVRTGENVEKIRLIYITEGKNLFIK